MTLLLLAFACTSSKDSAHSHDDSANDSHEADADTDSDADADADLTATTAGGLYTLTYAPTPNPPVSGDTALWMRLEDSSMSPVAGAGLSLTPWMPDMGHGIMNPPVVTELGSGEYNATWEYSMGGVWEVTVDITAGTGSDSVVLSFDVQ